MDGTKENEGERDCTVRSHVFNAITVGELVLHLYIHRFGIVHD